MIHLRKKLKRCYAIENYAIDNGEEWKFSWCPCSRAIRLSDGNYYCKDNGKLPVKWLGIIPAACDDSRKRRQDDGKETNTD